MEGDALAGEVFELADEVVWRQPKPAPMSLPWLERVAIVGRSPKTTDTAAAPQLIDRQVIARRKTLSA